jgi:hypothetical protein
VEEGRTEDGLTKMRDALRNLADADSLMRLASLGLLALALGEAGQLDQGLVQVDEALTLAER